MKNTRTTDYDLIAELNRDVQELHAQLFPSHFKNYDGAAIHEFFKQNVHRDNYIFLILEREDRPLGYAWIEIKQYAENAFRKSYESVYVHQISINGNDRNRGCGSKLMEAIAEIAQSYGIRRIELDYWSNNLSATRFYAKHGFQVYREFVYKEL